MAKRISKEELKREDAFLETGRSVAHFLEKNWTYFLAGLIGIVILGGVYIGFEQWKQHKEFNAQESLHVWMNQINEKQQEWSSKQPPASDQATPPEYDGDFEADFSPLVSSLEAEIKNYKNTVAAQSTAMKLADFLEAHKKPEKAAELLKQIEPAVDESTWLFGLFKLQLASLLSQSNAVDEALKRLESVTEVHSASFLHPEAYLKMALLYEEKGDLEKAKDLYSRVSTDYADQETGKSAQSYLQLLEIRQQLNPQEAPKTSQEGTNPQ